MISSEEYDEEYTLNLVDPLDNPTGFMPLVGREIETPKEVLDVIELKYQAWDARDCFGANKVVKAKIVRLGSGIEVIVPRQPFAFIHDLDDFYSNEPKSKKLDATKRAHKVLYNAIKENPERHTKKILLKLPRGIRVKGLPFNRDNVNLVNNLRFIQHETNPDEDGKKKVLKKRSASEQMDVDSAQHSEKPAAKPNASPMIFTKPYIYWAMDIDGEARIIAEDIVHDDDDFANACKHMTTMKF